MNKEIRRILKRITDILWAGGVTNPVTYIEQISYLIYLKMLDETESQYEQQKGLTGNRPKSLYPGEFGKYRWHRWCTYSGSKLRDFVGQDVFKYMANQLIKDAPRIANFFQSAVLEITDPAVLKEVIDELDKIEFKTLGPDVKGDLFEYLLTHMGQAALNGQFRTPRQIRAFMVEMVDPDFGDTIYDPACGTGGFLIDAVDYILAKYSEDPDEVPIYGEDWLDKQGLTLTEAKEKTPTLQTYRKGPGEKLPDWKTLEKSIYGLDVSRQIMRIAVMNAVLHGIPNANIKRANSLSSVQGLSEADLDREYSVILSNPPFAGRLPEDSIREDLPGNTKKSELLFLSVMMQALAPGGRCAVVVPEGLLFGSSRAHLDLRRSLVEQFCVRAVVSLPAGVFRPYAGVKTAVLVFERPRKESDAIATDHVWFYEVLNDGFDPDKISGGVRPETPEQNQLPDLMEQWRKYRKSHFKKPPGAKALESLNSEELMPACWNSDITRIAQNDYNLAASTYKPKVISSAPVEEPEKLISELLDVERRIVERLTELQSKVSES